MQLPESASTGAVLCAPVPATWGTPVAICRVSFG
jgi:hypothetical protein